MPLPLHPPVFTLSADKCASLCLSSGEMSYPFPCWQTTVLVTALPQLLLIVCSLYSESKSGYTTHTLKLRYCFFKIIVITYQVYLFVAKKYVQIVCTIKCKNNSSYYNTMNKSRLFKSFIFCFMNASYTESH